MPSLPGRADHQFVHVDIGRLADGVGDGGRGAFVRITETGRAAIERAAPGHVRSVRRLVFDALTAGEGKQLGEIFDRLRSRAGLSEEGR